MTRAPSRSLFVVLLLFVAASANAACPYSRLISFGGYDWCVKRSNGKVGPGPNYYSDSANNVWVDTQGRLHLKITRSGGRWYCAEVVSADSFGFGTYRFYLDSAVDDLDPNVVLGLFTWSDDPAYNNREIDIEFSRWGDPNNQNAQYVVQPYTQPQNITRFDMPTNQSLHQFLWEATAVSFRSVSGFDPFPPNPSDIIKEWVYPGPDVPQAGGENTRIVLFLRGGQRPLNRLPVEIVVTRFEFIP
ncbi:MAG: glycoside hydrolase family 16 protein [Gammaproteobacteria bacterium]